MPENKTLLENLVKMTRVGLAASSLSLLGVLAIIFGIGFDNDTTFHEADNYGPDGTWYKVRFYDRVEFGGDGENCIIGGMPQNVCNSLIKYGNVSDGKSAVLFDGLNEDAFLPEGMKVYIMWGKACNSAKPYGVITVPANVTKVRVPRLNKASANYEVFNIGVGGRMLNGHVNGLKWHMP